MTLLEALRELEAQISFSKAVLTLERVHSPEALVEPTPSGLRWRSATRFTYLKREGSGPGAKTSLWEEDAATGAVTKLLESIPAHHRPPLTLTIGLLGPRRRPG